VPWPLRFCQSVRNSLLADGILAIRCIGKFNYLQFVIMVSFITFGWTNFELQSVYEINKATQGGGGGGHQKLHARVFRLKLERNWWIALFSVVCWICVYILNERTRELERLRAETKELKKSK